MNSHYEEDNWQGDGNQSELAGGEGPLVGIIPLMNDSLPVFLQNMISQPGKAKHKTAGTAQDFPKIKVLNEVTKSAVK